MENSSFLEVSKFNFFKNFYVVALNMRTGLSYPQAFYGLRAEKSFGSFMLEAFI